MSSASGSESSSDSELFPEAVYTEETPLKPEIASIGTKSKTQVIAELRSEQLRLHQTTRPTAPPTRVTIEDKIQQLQAESTLQEPTKRPRGKDEPMAGFKRPKCRPKD